VDENHPKAQEKYPVSINILKSLSRFCIVILQHQVLLHIIAFKVSICIIDQAFNTPSIVRTRFLLHHARPTWSFVQQWAKQHYYVRSRKKTLHFRLQLNLQKHTSMCCCSFNKIPIKRNTLQENFDFMINNLTFFDLITSGSLMVSAWNLVCGLFLNFQKGRKILTFGCPTHNFTWLTVISKAKIRSKQ